jgi:hypothetical protein
MPTNTSRWRWRVVPYVVALALAACGRNIVAQPPTTLPPTFDCASAGYTWAYGDRLPAVEDAIKGALAASNISGDIMARTFGETGGCNGYSPIQLDVTIAVAVKGTADRAALSPLGQHIHDAVRQVFDQTKPAPNLGKIEITFASNGVECRWDLANNRCQE